MIGSEPIALPLGDTPIFLDIFNWLDIWLDALQFLLYYKTSMPFIFQVLQNLLHEVKRQESESDALPLGDTPIIKNSHNFHKIVI